MSAETELEVAAVQPETTDGESKEAVDNHRKVEGVDEQDRLGAIGQSGSPIHIPTHMKWAPLSESLECFSTVEFYFSDANLPFDKFMFLQTSPHLDPLKGPTLSAEAKAKAEAYGPGCSPVSLQTVASFKRMRPFSSKFPTSKLAQILQTNTSEPKLFEVYSEDANGKSTFFVRRTQKLEETKRLGASDRCVYVKGFLSEEDLAKEEPADMQIRLEKWAENWGPVAVLRMRREAPQKHKGAAVVDSLEKENTSEKKRWKNSVFIEFRNAGDAENLVHAGQQETDKPTFQGRTLGPVMFKIDYVSMKAKEMGLPAPKLEGQRKAFAPTQGGAGTVGGNSSVFNAFKELKAIAAGKQQYVCGPSLKSNGKDAQKAAEEKVCENVLEYEGNQLQVDKNGIIKDPTQLKNFRDNLVLGFELKGEAPSDRREARINYRELKTSLSEGDIVCTYLQMTEDSQTTGTFAFSAPIDDEMFAKIQGKSVQGGGRDIEFRRLTEEEQRDYHLRNATRKALAAFGPPNGNQRNVKNGRHGGGDGGRGGRGGRAGRGGRGRGRGGGKDRGRDRNAERSAAGGKDSAPANVDNPEGASTTSASKKRDVEGNVIGAPTTGATEPNSVPEVGRAEKKVKTND